MHLALCGIEKLDRSLKFKDIKQFLRAPEAVRIAVVVPLGEAFAGEQDGVRWIASPLLQNSTGSFEEFGSQNTNLLN